MIKNILIILFLFQNFAFAQLKAIDDIIARMERPQTGLDVGLDVASINEWIESTKTLSPDQAAESWAVLMQTIPANFGVLSRCDGEFSKMARYFELQVQPETQKALLRFLRLRMNFIEDSFTGWIFPTVLERRQAAVASSFRCLESMVGRDNSQAESDGCAKSFMWSQPLMSQERAYKALLAMHTIHRTMLIMSCSLIKQEASVGDREMAADFRSIQEIFQKYFFDRHWKFQTQKHISKWLSQFGIVQGSP